MRAPVLEESIQTGGVIQMIESICLSMFWRMKMVVIKKIKPAICIAGLYLAVPQGFALTRCAIDEGGSHTAFIRVSGISVTDVVNNAAGAWTKIAYAAADAGPSTNTGYINLSIYITTFGGNTIAVPGPFPMYFSGQRSLTAEIMSERGIPLPEGKDPKPCDPEKNACCQECLDNGWAMLDPNIDVFNGGFFPKTVVGMSNRGRRVLFAKSVEIEMII